MRHFHSSYGGWIRGPLQAAVLQRPNHKVILPKQRVLGFVIPSVLDIHNPTDRSTREVRPASRPRNVATDVEGVHVEY